MKGILRMFRNWRIVRLQRKLKRSQKELRDIKAIHQYTMMAVSKLKKDYTDVVRVLEEFNDQKSLDARQTALLLIAELRHIENVRDEARGIFNVSNNRINWMHGMDGEDLFI